jgi:hypothetical protein
MTAPKLVLTKTRICTQTITKRLGNMYQKIKEKTKHVDKRYSPKVQHNKRKNPVN